MKKTQIVLTLVLAMSLLVISCRSSPPAGQAINPETNIIQASAINTDVNYEFIFSFDGRGVTTSLVSDMGRNNWAFTDGGQNIQELYSLLNASLGSAFNLAAYQRLADYVISSLLYIDLAGFFIWAMDIPIDIATNPEIVGVDFTPASSMTQLGMRLRFGNFDASIYISRYPGAFIRLLNQDFVVEYRETNNAVRLYFISGER